MSKLSRDVLLERTTDAEVFQDMDNFELLNDSSTFALSLRLQFPKFSKGFTSSDFEPFVKQVVGDDNLVSLGRLSFPNEWQMQVKSKTVRENLIRLGRTKINTRTCWISPLSQSEVRGYIHWIPSAIPNTKLEEILRAFGEILLMENQKQTKFKTKVDCDSRYFGLYLKSGKTMDDVPHFFRVDEYYGLITIRGRSPCCFHCKEVGHRKSECKIYREKISDYCMRPAGQGVPRIRPRGKRFRKHWLPKKIDQEVQTSTTCSECIKERLAANAKETAEHVSNAEGTEQPSGAEGTEQPSKAEGTEQPSKAETSTDTSDAIGVRNDDMLLVLSKEDAEKPGFWKRVRKEKKRLRREKEDALLAEFKAQVKAITQGPLKNLSNRMRSLSLVSDDGKVIVQGSASGESSDDQDRLKSMQELRGVIEKAYEMGVNATLSPVGKIELLHKTVIDVLDIVEGTVDHHFDAARQVLLKEEKEQANAGKKKKKKRQRKKKNAVVEGQANN